MCIGWWCDAERRLSPRASFSTEKLRARLAPAVECVGCFSRRGPHNPSHPRAMTTTSLDVDNWVLRRGEKFDGCPP